VVPSEIKIQSPQTPSKQELQPVQPSPIEQPIKALMPPNCGDPELQKTINALYSDPVIISFYVVSAIAQE
jgi:hypothetical protein